MATQSKMKITLLHPARFRLDGGAMFGIIPKPLWEKKITPDEHNRILMSLRLILIEQLGEQVGEQENKKILIDTGIGFNQEAQFNHQFALETPHSSMENFLRAAAGIEPSQITDIISTHLHFDHIGGLGQVTKEGEAHLNFPNATLWLHQDHFAYAKNPTLRDAGSFHHHQFLPLIDLLTKKNQLQFLSGMEGEIKGLNISYLTSMGHTPYMIHPIFDHYIYMADLVPMLHHIHLPWVMGYDIEPGITTQYKEKFYQKIISDNLTMIFEHDDQTWGAVVEQKAPLKFTAKQTFSSQGLTSIIL